MGIAECTIVIRQKLDVVVNGENLTINRSDVVLDVKIDRHNMPWIEIDGIHYYRVLCNGLESRIGSVIGKEINSVTCWSAAVGGIIICTTGSLELAKSMLEEAIWQNTPKQNTNTIESDIDIENPRWVGVGKESRLVYQLNRHEITLYRVDQDAGFSLLNRSEFMNLAATDGIYVSKASEPWSDPPEVYMIEVSGRMFGIAYITPNITDPGVTVNILGCETTKHKTIDGARIYIEDELSFRRK